ncbi:MAG: translocation/assembly module TamB domain-containing protein [Rhizobacter sp.]|nr:translocation/assembly module TamB domain-containing protein [Bacteriovorax sp.]
MNMTKQVLKRLSLIIAGFIGMILIAIITIAVTFFYNPTIFINPKNLDYALKKTSVLKSWSWKSAAINHQWIAWNKRRFYGGFEDLCLVYDNPDVFVDTCLEKVSWNVELNWTKESGFKYEIYEPLVVESTKLKITPKDNPEETPPPDIMSYWKMLWSPIVPDMSVHFAKIEILKKEHPLTFDLKLKKDPSNLDAEALGFNLHATKDKITLTAPKKVLLPYDLKTNNPLYFDEIKIEATIGETDIPVVGTAKLASATLKLNSKISRASLKEDLSKPKFLRQVILNTSASMEIEKLKSTVAKLVRPPFNVLPAPINAMEGSLKLIITTDNVQDNNSVLLKVRSELDMKGPKQELKMALNSEIPFKVNDKSIGAVTIGLELQKVNLLLPQMSRTRLPPQLKPDSRFKNSVKVVHENLNEKKIPPKVKKAPAKKVEVSMRLQALGENALHINTNLLDEVLKLNFDLEIADGQIVKGYIQTLPFRTTVFKRKLIIQSVRFVFNAPLEPEIIARIQFDLPEYLITLDLEGPLSKPRQAFSSIPALPVDDIYAVILFGRPLEGLDPDDKSAARNTNQILSQGILSLAVLYYFAGSPVESLGYNPNSNVLSAQIGLGSKNSLRVGGSGNGLNSAGIRRSLGKGWYIDSSVQKATTTNGTSTGDYGVLLERIISY